MSKKILVIFHSLNGTTEKMAQHLIEYGRNNPETEVVAIRIPEVEHVDDFSSALEQVRSLVEGADGILWGTPGRYGNVSGPMKIFIDNLADLHERQKFRDVPMGVFISTGSAHGGQETTFMSFFTMFIHWGAIIVPNGAHGTFTGNKLLGNPYGVSYSLAQAAQDKEYDLFIRKSLEETLNRLIRVNIS